MKPEPAQASERPSERGHAADRYSLLPGQSPEGGFILSVLVKRTYDFFPDRQCERAEKDDPLFSGDVYHDDPANSSVKYESDFVPYKTATDIVLIGVAHAPGAKPAEQFETHLIVGSHCKTVLVFGDRFCRYESDTKRTFTNPVPVESVEMVYERAFGGIDILSDERVRFPYPRNPLGTGFVVDTGRKAVDGLRLPNFEDPENRLTPENICVGDYKNWEKLPVPAGFGWVPRHWEPRASRGGVMPADRKFERGLRNAYATVLSREHREKYLGHPLPSVDFGFFNGASQGLAVAYLSGEEPVTLVNLTREGKISFGLPGQRPAIGIDIGNGLQEPEAVLHTVAIRAEDRQADLVWRGAIPYPGPDWLPKMKKMDVRIA